jgi:dTDP-D-glucose 4,6-dehydratase
MASIIGKSAEVRRLLGSLVLDSTKIRSETGWIPRYTMSQGLRETIESWSANQPLTSEVSSACDRHATRLGPSSKH